MPRHPLSRTASALVLTIAAFGLPACPAGAQTDDTVAAPAPANPAAPAPAAAAAAKPAAAKAPADAAKAAPAKTPRPEPTPAIVAKTFPFRVPLGHPAVVGASYVKERGLILYSKGPANVPVMLSPGKYRLTIRAQSGGSLDGETAKYQAKIAGKKHPAVQTAIEPGDASFEFETRKAGTVPVAIHFLNDKQGKDEKSGKDVDLNLYVLAVSCDRLGDASPAPKPAAAKPGAAKPGAAGSAGAKPAPAARPAPAPAAPK